MGLKVQLWRKKAQCADGGVRHQGLPHQIFGSFLRLSIFRVALNNLFRKDKIVVCFHIQRKHKLLEFGRHRARPT